MKTRSSVVAGLLQQSETLESVYKDSQEAAGSAVAENEKYMESIKGHMAELKSQWQSLWTSDVSREFINTFIDIGKGALELVDKFGLLQSAAVGFTALFSVKSLLRGNGKKSGGRFKATLNKTIIKNVVMSNLIICHRIV